MAAGRLFSDIQKSKTMEKKAKVLAQLYEEANKIYHNYLWNGSNTEEETQRLAELRRQYILQSGGKQMPELQYKSFSFK